MKKNKYLLKKKLMFSDIFEIKEEAKEKSGSSSSSQSESSESNSSTNKYSNQQIEENNLTNPIIVLIYAGIKKDSIVYDGSKSISNLIKYLKKKKFFLNSDKGKNDIKVLYSSEELKITDERPLHEILTEIKDKKDIDVGNEIKVIIKTKEKEYIKNRNIEKVYVSLENIPSFMDLSEQINSFLKKYKEEIKYDIKYKNNCCIIIFLSSEISFSFVTFMTNLKFRNKYYRKLIVKLKYNSDLVKNSHYLSQQSMMQNSRNRTALRTINSHHNSKINIKNNFNNKNMKLRNSGLYEKKPASTEPTIRNDYFYEKYSFLNESTPYGQERIINIIEKEKNKKKWITNKGFFNGVNKKSFNSFVNPYNKKILLSNISSNKEKKIFLNIKKI